MGPLPSQESARRYLDLMKRVLTRTGFSEFVLLRARNRARWILEPVQAALGSRGYALVQRSRDRPASQWSARTSGCETILSIPRLDAIQKCVETLLVDEIPGDLIELGVWRGGGSIFLRAVLAAHSVRDRRVWVADSFSGFPNDRDRDPTDRGIDFAGGLGDDFFAVDVETVKGNFARYGLLDDQVEFLEGWFHETLPAAPIKTLALLLFDGDLYSSTRDSLVALYPKVSPGGFVVVDDYGCHENCRRAVDEFRAANGIDEPLVNVDDQMVLWRRRA